VGWFKSPLSDIDVEEGVRQEDPGDCDRKGTNTRDVKITTKELERGVLLFEFPLN